MSTVNDSNIDRAVAQLLATGDPLLALDAVDEKLRQEMFIRYFQFAGDQQQIIQAMKERPDWKVMLLLGGNGSGKSITGSSVSTAWMLGKEFFVGSPAWDWVQHFPIPDGPTSVRGVALNSDMLRDPMWENLIGSSDHPQIVPPAFIAERSNHLFTLRLTTGSKFHGKSADTDPKTHGGANCDLVWLDEECSKAIFDENYQRTRKGGRLLVTATPLDDVGTVSHPWIFDMIQQWEAGDPEIIVIFMSVLNNPYLSEQHKRQQIAKWRGHPEEQARLYGRPVRRSGLYYKSWKSAPPIFVPAQPLPKDGLRVVMIDPAVTGTVGALFCHVNARGDLRLYKEYKEKQRPVSYHVEQILALAGNDPINFWWADPFMGRQRVPDAQTTDQHKTVVQVWRDAGLHRLALPQLDYETCLTESFEYIQAAFDQNSPRAKLTVDDHLTAFEDEIGRYVIDSVAQGQKKGDTLDRPRKGRDGSSTLMECYQYICGMRPKARGGGGVIQLVDPALRSSF